MGNAYGITGPNGVGKTTILNTILGLYNKELPPNVLKINGFYYNDIVLSFCSRNSIATTEQEPILLPGSLLENIYLWSNYNKDTYVSNLFSDFNLDHLSSISTTDVSSSLSGGRKQKIALLRSFFQKRQFNYFRRTIFCSRFSIKKAVSILYKCYKKIQNIYNSKSRSRNIVLLRLSN